MDWDSSSINNRWISLIIHAIQTRYDAVIEAQVAENGNYRVVFSGWEKEGDDAEDKKNEGR